MRTKAHHIKDNLYVIELKDEIITRLIVTHKNYDLSYELLTIYNDDLEIEGRFDIKSYIKGLNYEKLFDYLIDVNSESDDFLYHDDIEIVPLIEEKDE